MERRKFLKLVGLGAATASIAGVSLGSVTLKEASVGIILHEFSYLKIDKKEVESFVNDFLPTLDVFKEPYIQGLVRSLYYLKVSAQQSDMVELLSSNFLLSTDFFWNKMNTNKPVKYLRLYNPVKNPCSNPFSSFYYPV